MADGRAQVSGTLVLTDFSAGSGEVSNDDLAGSITRSKLLQETLESYWIPFTSMRVWDARQTLLPATAATDDLAVITGTFGTDAITLQGLDSGGTTTTGRAAFQFQLPPEYDDGQTITVRARCAMITTVSDGTATVDLEVHKLDQDGAVGADICGTAAATINDLSAADVDFTITPTGVIGGDVLDCRITFAVTDAGDLGVMIPECSHLEFLLDIKG